MGLMSLLTVSLVALVVMASAASAPSESRLPAPSYISVIHPKGGASSSSSSVSTSSSSSSTSSSGAQGSITPSASVPSPSSSSFRSSQSYPQGRTSRLVSSASHYSGNLLDEESSNYARDPYNFGYDVKDDYGNHQYRKEESDSAGTVRGTYGYQDALGIYRFVDYYADHTGFHATIRSNEPGVGPAHGANIILDSQVPPKNVYDYKPSSASPRSAPASARRLSSNLIQLEPVNHAHSHDGNTQGGHSHGNSHVTSHLRTPYAHVDVHHLASGSERSNERLRYSFPIPAQSAPVATTRERDPIASSSSPSTSPSTTSSATSSFSFPRESTTVPTLTRLVARAAFADRIDNRSTRNA